MVDLHVTAEEKTIGGVYSCFLIYVWIFLALGILFFLIMTFVVYNQLAAQWFSRGFWWIFIFSPIAFIFLGIMVLCFIRWKEDKLTQSRHMHLHMALKKA
jgi:hypothetical protein